MLHKCCRFSERWNMCVRWRSQTLVPNQSCFQNHLRHRRPSSGKLASAWQRQTLHSSLQRICPYPPSRSPAMTLRKLLPRCGDLLLRESKCVHCELLLLQTFSTNCMKFWMDQPFFGCSKPACYTCGTYLSAHPDGFVRPSFNPRIFPCLLPPPIDNGVDLEKHQKVWEVLQAKAERDLLSLFYPEVMGD